MTSAHRAVVDSVAPPPTFADDGYRLLCSFLTAAEVAEAVAAVSRSHSQPADPSCVRANNTLLPLRWCDPVIDLVLASRHRVERLAESVEADDLRWVSGYVSSKEPRTGALAWHQDWWCWDHPVSFRRRAPQVALLCYLTATSRDSGALRILPGSHLTTTPLHGLLPEAHDDDKQQALPAFEEVPGAVTLSLSPGDAVVLDYRILHGTHANTAEARRDALLLSFTPSWRSLAPTTSKPT